MRIVADSSPLIALAVLNQLDLLDRVFSELSIPQAVYDEVSEWSKPYARKLQKFLKEKITPVENHIAIQLLKKDVRVYTQNWLPISLE